MRGRLCPRPPAGSQPVHCKLDRHDTVCRAQRRAACSWSAASRAGQRTLSCAQRCGSTRRACRCSCAASLQLRADSRLRLQGSGLRSTQQQLLQCHRAQTLKWKPTSSARCPACPRLTACEYATELTANLELQDLLVLLEQAASNLTSALTLLLEHGEPRTDLPDPSLFRLTKSTWVTAKACSLRLLPQLLQWRTPCTLGLGRA